MGLNDFKNSSSGRGTNSGRSRQYTKEELKGYLREFYNKRDYITYESYNSADEYSSSGTVESYFGSWNQALRDAGIPVSLSSTKVDVTEDMLNPSCEKAYIVGVILGDASISVNCNGGKYIQLGVIDKCFAERFGEVLCDYLGLDWCGWGSDETDVCCSELTSGSSSDSDMWTVNKGIAPIYDHIVEYQNLSLNSSSVTDVLELSDEFKGYHTSLLRGLWDSEGSVNQDWGGVSFRNTNLGTIRLYIELIDSITSINVSNDYSILYEESSGYLGDLYINSESDKVLISKDMCEEFYYTVQPTIQRKRDILKEFM